jgi:hypothetical protein
VKRFALPLVVRFPNLVYQGINISNTNVGDHFCSMKRNLHRALQISILIAPLTCKDKGSWKKIGLEHF